MLPSCHGFSTESRLMDLPVQLLSDMRQAVVIVLERIWRISAEYDALYTQAFSGTQQRADIVAAAQIMRDEDYLSAFGISHSMYYSRLLIYTYGYEPRCAFR